MKNKTLLIPVLLVLSALPLLAQELPLPETALDAAPVDSLGEVGNSFLLLLIAMVTPMIVRLGKFLVPQIPSWVLPILAPALVATADWLSGMAGGPSVNPMLALLLGAAGTGIREIKDQTQQRIQNGPAIKIASSVKTP